MTISSRAAELAAANSELEVLHRENHKLVGIVVHDLKNPRNGVIGLWESPLAEDLPPEERMAVFRDAHVSAWGMLDQENGLR